MQARVVLWSLHAQTHLRARNQREGGPVRVWAPPVRRGGAGHDNLY